MTSTEAPAKSFSTRWTVVDDLSKGGHGQTRLVRAHNAAADAPLAVLKTLHNNRDPERRRRMHLEVLALQTLDHPRIPSVIDYNTEAWNDPSYTLYFVQEYIEGKPLGDWAESFDGELAVAVELTKQLVKTADYCHTRLIVHRDIKPDNIIMPLEGAGPVLLDFGQAFNHDVDAQSATWTGQHLGNRFLVLPELQAVKPGAGRDFRTDLTQCAGILFFLITKQYPTKLRDEHGLPPHRRQEVQPAITASPMPERLLHFFDVAFQVPIDARWPTSDAFRSALDMLLPDADAEHAAKTRAHLLSLIGDRVKRGPDFWIKRNFSDVHETIRNCISEAVKGLHARVGAEGFQTFPGASRADPTTLTASYEYGVCVLNNRARGFIPTFTITADEHEVRVVGTSSNADPVTLLVAPSLDFSLPPAFPPALDAYLEAGLIEATRDLL